MRPRLTQVDFEAGNDFEWFPIPRRAELQDRFASLQERLVSALLASTETVGLRPRFELAANEAAAVAWTTDYPLLVFPALMEEFVRRERSRDSRQARIRAKSEKLMAEAR